MEQANGQQTSVSNIPQTIPPQYQVDGQPISNASSKKPFLFISVILGLLLFGIGGYVLGTKQNEKEAVSDNNLAPTSPPVTTSQYSITASPTTTAVINPLEPNLVTMTNWKTVSFPQNVVVSQGGNSRSAKVEFKIPPTWTAEAIKAKTDEQIDGVVCKDFQISSQDKQSVLIINPDCGGSSPDYLIPDASLQVVELTSKKGNDGHDSYTVRYLSGANYKYGEIGVSPGEKIDLSKDKIYPRLVLQYEPNRYEQWLFTSIDLTYSGTASSKQTALSTADSIVSTIRLAD